VKDKYSIYDYVHPEGGNLMKTWSANELEKKERAKLNAKIDMLRLHGPELIPGILSPTGRPNIFKLRVKGKVQLRPMVCEGPGMEPAFTLLMGAKEISSTYVPADAPEKAAVLRADLLANPERRVKHERVD
jgi:hypothetical protein